MSLWFSNFSSSPSQINLLNFLSILCISIKPSSNHPYQTKSNGSPPRCTYLYFDLILLDMKKLFPFDDFNGGNVRPYCRLISRGHFSLFIAGPAKRLCIQLSPACRHMMIPIQEAVRSMMACGIKFVDAHVFMPFI